MSLASWWNRYWYMKQGLIESEMGMGGRKGPENIHFVDHGKKCGFYSKCMREQLESFNLGERPPSNL